MQVLIIAAGEGTRLRHFTTNIPKPLIKILGRSIIEHVILNAKEAGINEFFIVIGYLGEQIKSSLKDGKKLGVKIHYLENADWKKGNGTSVLKAKSVLKNNFFLLMSDHFFDSHILTKMKSESIASHEIMLAVDYNMQSPFVDLDDVTKVKVQDAKIVNIGKEIKEYNCYDTGVFLCSSSIFPALEESMKNNVYSLSGGIEILAKERKANIFDIKNKFWIDLDTEEYLKKAEEWLLDKRKDDLYKGKTADGFIARYINRKVSQNLFTPLILKFYKGVTPNQVSVFSFLVSIVGGALFFFAYPVWGGIIVQLSSILDGSDGEVARYKKMASSIGNFFDAFLDRYSDFFILLGVFYYTIVKVAGERIWNIDFSLWLVIFVGSAALFGMLMSEYLIQKSIAGLKFELRNHWLAQGRRDFRLFIVFLGGVLSYFNPIFSFLALLLLAIETNSKSVGRFILTLKYFK